MAASLHPLELVLAPLQWSYYSIMFGLRWLRLSSRIGDIERCLTVSHCWHQPRCNAALPTQLAVGRHCQIDLGPGGGGLSQVLTRCARRVLPGGRLDCSIVGNTGAGAHFRTLEHEQAGRRSRCAQPAISMRGAASGIVDSRVDLNPIHDTRSSQLLAAETLLAKHHGVFLSPLLASCDLYLEA